MPAVCVLFVMTLGFLVSFAATAEAQWRYPFCKQGIWSVIETADLERQGFELIRERMQQAVHTVLKDTDRLADVLITDCPIYKQVEISLEILPEQFATIGMPQVRDKRRYRIYFTTLFLEDMAQDELVEWAVTQACVIRTGIYDGPMATWTDEVDVAVIRCRIETAEQMGSVELARWLRRYLRE